MGRFATKIKELSPWYQQFTIDGDKTTAVGLMNDDYFSKIRPLFPEELTGKKVLDLACNAGLVSFSLAKLGAKVIGFDNNEKYIDQANFVMVTTDVPKVKFIKMDIEKLRTSFYSPNIIVVLSAIYHLSKPTEFIKGLSIVDVVASFRLPLYNTYTEIFKKFGYDIVAEADYGRKRAALFRQP